MAALGKRSTAPEEECNLDPWGQPWITDAQLKEAKARVRRANVTPLWAMVMIDAGIMADSSYENAANLVAANHIVQHAKKQREFLAQKKKEEEQEKEMQERSTAPEEKEVRDPARKKQKSEEDSDAGRSPQALLDEMIKEGDELWGPVVAGSNEEEDCKACAFAQKSPNLHRLRHSCGASNIHLDWRPEHDEEDEGDKDDEKNKNNEKEKIKK